MTDAETILRWRREKFLLAIDAPDLWAMQRRVAGNKSRTTIQTRWEIIENWDLYEPELRRWCDYTLTGENTL